MAEAVAEVARQACSVIKVRTCSSAGSAGAGSLPFPETLMDKASRG
jgi:hypothetical protein